jgi:hypothetical protein
MPATYEPIATTTLSSAAASITFSSIPATYTDLRFTLLINTTSAASEGIRLQYNSDTATNYSDTYLSGNGASAVSGQDTGASFIILHYAGTSTTVPTFYFGDVFSYAGSTYKTALVGSVEDKNGSGNVTRGVGLWRSTSAITTLKLGNAGVANFNAGTTATLYGILKA